MELVLITLTAPAAPARQDVEPQTLIDILWANATPDCRLEHVSVRAGPDEKTYTVALFLLPPPHSPRESDAPSVDDAARLCRQAIAASPALAGWTAEVDTGELHLGCQQGRRDFHSR